MNIRWFMKNPLIRIALEEFFPYKRSKV